MATESEVGAALDAAHALRSQHDGHGRDAVQSGGPDSQDPAACATAPMNEPDAVDGAYALDNLNGEPEMP